MKLYSEHSERQKKGEEVDVQVQKRVPEHREWVEAVFDVILFLTLNGLPLRGHNENTDFNSDSAEGGIFINTFTDLLFKRNPRLKKNAQRLPANAKYTSPKIQNEVIDVLYNLVKGKVAYAIRRSQLYTIMMDGTTEKMGHELLGIVGRYVDEDSLEVSEHVIGVKDATDDKSAHGLLDLLKSTLDDAGISLDGVVSQTYDGASVMSGHVGGVQTLFSHLCGKEVPYIHCYCHRLKLVIDELLKTVPSVSDHFSLLSALYDFFKLSDVNKLYNGDKLKRLIETR